MPTTNDNRISAALTDQDMQDISDAYDTIESKLAFLVNLHPDERKKKRKTGSKREGYVLDVHEGSQSFLSAVPSSFKMDEWNKDETLAPKLKQIFSRNMILGEKLDDSLLQLGFERIRQADEVYGYLKVASTGNAALSELLERIARQFLGQGRRAEVPVTTVDINGSRGIVNAVLNSYLLNEGETLLKVSMENGSRVVQVRPGDAVKVSSASLTVTNMSSTTEGKFSVKTR
jgi:hypothetical protein